MMMYAESTDCRTQMLRGYFGEDRGERCGRCDNCERMDRDAAEAATAPPVEAHAEAAGQIVETKHGVMRASTAEALEAAEEATCCEVGDRVQHKSFGIGTIRDVHGTNAAVRFDNLGEKRVPFSFLRKIA